MMKELEGITVSTSKPIYMNEGEKILYNVSEDAAVQTGTVADALQNAPGVEVDIEGNITLRGVTSVEIWINDRPSKLSAENLKTYIQQMPANALERIEVINNPSAHYSAKGTGGIINIVTKDNIKKNSFLSFGINASTRPAASPWISYMYANEKFSINVYTYGYYINWSRKMEGSDLIFNDNLDTSSYGSFKKQTKADYLSMGGYINSSYRFDSLKTISFWGGVWGDIFDRNSFFMDYKWKEYINDPGIYDFTEEAKGSHPYIGGHAGIEYEHNFDNDGHNLVFSFAFNIDKDKEYSSLIRKYKYFSEQNKNYIINNVEKESYLEATIDYTLPYHEDGEFEVGINCEFEIDRFDHKTDTLFNFDSDIYLLDSLRYQNHLGHNLQIDLFSTVEHSFGNFTIKGGLRFQNYFYRFNTLNKPEINGQKYYPDLFPSLHLSYKTKKMHNFSLSYTRRIGYPSVSQLNPFKIYEEDEFSMGNINLRPTFTNSIEGGWTKYFEKFGSVGLSAYFKNDKDHIFDLTDVVFEDYYGRYVSFEMPVNAGKSHRYGAELNVTWKLKAFMNVRLYSGVVREHSETLFRGDNTEITNSLSYNFRINFWAKLWKFLEINASGYYRSKSKSLFAEQLPAYSINCGLRADFWQKKISVHINVIDIFNWYVYKENNTNPYYIAYNSTKYVSRFISAGITFRFGKMELESRAKTGGNTE